MTVSPRARGGGGSAKKAAKKAGGKAKNAASASMSSASAAASANANANAAPPPTVPSVWRPGYDPLEEDETLQYDPTAYDCMHTFTLEWPCLSFDVLRDAATAARVANASSSNAANAAAAAALSKKNLNSIGTATTPAAAAAVASFPHTLFLAAGTQAATRSANSLSLLRLGRVGRGKHGPAARRLGDSDDDDDGLSSDSDDESDAPTLAARRVRVNAGVNRVRAMPQHPGIVAAWLDSGVVSIWDLRRQLRELEATTDAESARAEERERNPRNRGKDGGSGASAFLSLSPVASHRHGAEGFGLAWSPGPAPGRLASGDCGGGLRVWEPREGGASATTTATATTTEANQSSTLSWAVSQPYGGHEHDGGRHRASVEDVAWSPTEATVFATAATDAALRVFDVRAPSRPQLVVRGAHASDVNVVSWSPLATFMLASGGDDGAVKAWDLRAVAGSGSGGGGGGGGNGNGSSNNEQSSSGSRKIAPAAAAAAAPGEVARLCYHRGAVTSVEWSPTESSVLLSTGDSTDGTTCVWDLAVERDPEEEAALGAGAAAAAALAAGGGGIDESALPPQLLFVHAGQADVKEAHWHPQIDGLVASTAADGFNVWRASNV